MAWKRPQVQILYSPLMRYLSILTNTPVILSLLFTAFVCAIKYPFDFFWARFDVYYHAVHSQSYIDSFDITYPVFTYFSLYPADLWYAYHLLTAGAYFIGNLFGTLTAEQATVGLHVFYTFILSAILLWFFKVLFNYANDRTGKLTLGWYLTFLSILVIAFPHFTVRVFFYERPHVFMIGFVLLAMIAVLKQRYGWLFFLALLAPLTYSFSLFIFLPLVILFLGYVIETKRIQLNEELKKILFYTVSGFTMGILFHPNSIGYLINGLAFHTFAILQSATPGLPTQMGKLVVPDEMTFMRDVFPIFHSIVAFGLLISFDIKRHSFNKTSYSDLHRSAVLTGLLVMSLLLLAASIFVIRAIEYAIPLAVATFIVMWPMVGKELKTAFSSVLTNTKSKTSRYLRVCINLFETFLSYLKRPITHFVLFILIVAATTKYLYLPYAEVIKNGARNYSAAAEYLSSEATDGEVIIQTQFATYPSLLRANPSLKIATGMDARMIYFYDPELSYLYAALLKTAECYKECPYTREEALEKLRERYEINHILVEESFLEEQMFEHFENDERYELVFIDENDDRIKIYKVH